MKGFLSIPHMLAAALQVRESPQERSHQKYVDIVKNMINLNNTLSLPDPVLGLLTDSAAISILGTLPAPNCLQANAADLAFTNAKAANNAEGMVASLVYRALERNTDAVGLASERCTAYTMVNREFTFNQHQDPASPGARLNNKAVVLELARQIARVGGDPMVALDSGTFAPGDLDTLAGNSCSEDNCIFEQNRLVKDATDEEVFDYVAKCVETIFVTVSGMSSTGTAMPGLVTSGSAPPQTLPTSSPITQATTAAVTPPPQQTTTQQQQTAPPPEQTTSRGNEQNGGQNLQTYQGALLGIPAPPVTGGGNSFTVEGSEFNNLRSALARSCDIQKTFCARAANAQGGSVTVPQCDQQEAECKAGNQS